MLPDSFYKLSIDEFNDICTAFRKYNSPNQNEDENILQIEDLNEQIADMQYWYG